MDRPASRATETFEAGPFDSNDSGTIETVQSSGGLELMTITTNIARSPEDPDGNETA